MTKISEKFNEAASFGAVFNSLFTSVNSNRPNKLEPYVPINMRCLDYSKPIFYLHIG